MTTNKTSGAAEVGEATAALEHTPAGTQAPLGTDATSPAPGVPAGLLREAAALMRERAEAVDLTPARVSGRDDLEFSWVEQIRFIVIEPDATHLTTFGHPAVALAVAGWLEFAAEREQWRSEFGGYKSVDVDSALAVARAYLGGDR